MKFTVAQKTFLKALAHGHKVVEKHTTVPILSHTLLKAEENAVSMTSTDLEMSLVEKIESTVDVPGTIAVPTHMLHDIVRKLPATADLTVHYDAETGQAEIVCGKIDFRIPCLPPEDFPAIKQEDLPHSFELPSPVLKDLLNKTRFAMSNEETRYYLNGVHFHIKDGKEMRVVATDGHRLAQTSIGIPQGAEDMPGIILSRKTVNELIRLLQETNENVQISTSDTQATFSVGDIFLSTRLIDGTFPDYEAVVPAANDRMIQVDVQEFSSAIDRVSTVSSEKERGIRLSVERGKMTLKAVSNENGSGLEEILVDYEGDPLEIGFNAAYLMDVADQMPGGTAQFALKDTATAALIQDPQENSSIYVVMPMRV